MKKNKIILNHCKNYYKIEDFEYDNDDYITDKLISLYEDYIFNINEKNNDDIKKIETLDIILGKYVDDYVFRKEIKKQVLNITVNRDSNIIESIVNSLIKLFENYEEGYTRNIYFARWI